MTGWARGGDGFAASAGWPRRIRGVSRLTMPEFAIFPPTSNCLSADYPLCDLSCDGHPHGACR